VEKLKKIIENIPCPAYILDRNLKVVVWNKECEKISGLSQVEVLNTSNFWKLYGKRIKTPAIKLKNSDKIEMEENIKINNKTYSVYAYKFEDYIVEIIKNIKFQPKSIEKKHNHQIYHLNKILLKMINKYLNKIFNIKNYNFYLKINNGMISVIENIKFSDTNYKIINSISNNIFKIKIDKHVCILIDKEKYRLIIFDENSLTYNNFEQLILLLDIITEIVVDYLKLSNELHIFKSLIDKSNEGILILDEKLNILSANKIFEKMIKRKVLGLNLKDIILDFKKFEKSINNVFYKGKSFCKIKIYNELGESINCFVRIYRISNYICCLFTEEKITSFYNYAKNIILSENSYLRLCLKISKLIDKQFDTLFTWYYINGKFYQTKKYKYNLKNYIDKISCIVNSKNCKDCYICKIYNECYYFSYIISERPKIVFGIVFKRKPEKRVLNSIINVLSFVKFSIKHKIIEENLLKITCEIVKCIEEINVCSDKFLNPLFGSYLLIDTILNSEDIKLDEVKEKLKIIEKSLEKMNEYLNKIRVLENKFNKLLDKIDVFIN